MADLKISQLAALAGANLATADELAIVDSSASETKKITVTDLVGNATTLIADATIPGAKILFGAGDITGASIADGGISTAKVADDAITAAKLGNESTVDLVTTLPGAGAFTGQIALDTDDNKIYIWDGSAWQSVKGAGSVNVVNGNTTGILNITVTTVGDTVTITPSFDNTTAAAQFLGGPTGGTGVVGYRAIVGTDLPTPTTSVKGGVIVNGEGLRMDGDTIEVDNDITANSSTYQAVQFDSKGLITAGRDITAADLPAATSGAVGAIKPGTGLTMGVAGALNHTNALTGATATKVTFDAQGHVSSSSALIAADIPDLDTAKITTGTFATEQIADNAITGAKIGDKATATIASTTPAGGEFIGQYHFNSLNRELFLWDGNVWQPIGISVGEIILSGTFDASAGGGTGLIASVTAEGTAVGLVVGQALPAAAATNSNYYLVVSQPGTITSGNAPNVALAPPDFLLSNGSSWTKIDVSDTVVAQQASNVSFTPAGGLSANNVQTALEELDTEKVGPANPTFTGDVTISTGGTLILEGATANAFETTLTVTDPTADRTITFPNVTGNVVTTGDTGTVTSLMITDGAIVDADINANAEIAVSKLVDGTARQLLQTDAAGTGVEWASNIDIPGTLDVTGAATLDSTLVVTSNANAASFIPTGSSVPTNGVYLPAANTLAFATNTSERIRIGASGQIGLAGANYGTSGQVLTSGGSSAVPTWTTIDTSVDKINEGNTSAEVIDTGSDGRFVVTTEGSEAMRVDNSGNVSVGSTTTSGTGVHLRPFGNVVSRRASGSLQVFEGYQGSTLTSEIRADGSAKFASDIKSSFWDAGGIGYRLDVGGAINLNQSGSGASISVQKNGSQTAAINGDGSATFSGYHTVTKEPNSTFSIYNAVDPNGTPNSDRYFFKGTSGSATRFSVATNGSATFAGFINVNDVVTVSQPTGTYNCFAASLNNTTNATIKANGSATFAGSGRFRNGDTSTGYDVYLGSQSDSTDNIIAGYDYGTNTTPFKVTKDGSATFAGPITAGSAFNAGDGVQAYGGGSVYIRQDGAGSSNNLFTILNGGSAASNRKATIFGDGSATFAGNVVIGATSSTSKLRVIGNEIRFSNSSNASYYGTITHDAGTTGANIYNNVDGTTASHIFQHNGTEKMQITSVGMINVSSDTGYANGIKYVNGSSTSTQHFDRIFFGASNYYIINNSSVGVRLGSGNTSWSSQSDERLKTNLTEISGGLGKVSTLRAVTGRYLNDETTVSRSFLIAQDVRDVLPEAVTEDNDDNGTLNLRYTEVIPLLVAALKESKERIETLETKVAALEAG